MAGEGYWRKPVPSTIGDLSDVDTSTTAPTDGQSLVWDDGAGEWVPGDAAVTAAAVRDAGRWEVLVTGNPAEAVTTEDETDWIHAWITD